MSFFRTLFLFLCVFSCLKGEIPYGPHTLAIGPESYYLKRTKSGGTWQTGWMNGGRLTYQRLKPFSLYWGGTALYAMGTLKGKSGLNQTLKSTFTDQEIEGHLGYTVQGNLSFKPTFTPFFGLGYWDELNNYKSPSPLPLHFKTTFPYFIFAFLAKCYQAENWNIGFNAKGMAMSDAKCKVSNDPSFPSTTLEIEDKINFRLELPFNYLLSRFSFQCIPFYEKRHYGGKSNLDFNFVDTKIQIYGINLNIAYQF